MSKQPETPPAANASVGSAFERAWEPMRAFQLFAEYVPMAGFPVLIRLYCDGAGLVRALAKRHQAGLADALDPDLAMAFQRAVLGTMESMSIQLAWATAEEALIVAAPGSLDAGGSIHRFVAELIGRSSARLAMLSGQELTLFAEMYELPDSESVEKAFVLRQEWAASALIDRWAARLAAQFGSPEPANAVQRLALVKRFGLKESQAAPWWTHGIAAVRGANGPELLSGMDSVSLRETCARVCRAA